jgi:LuxR family maltose regulon positive regulatory protein
VNRRKITLVDFFKIRVILYSGEGGKLCRFLATSILQSELAPTLAHFSFDSELIATKIVPPRLRKSRVARVRLIEPALMKRVKLSMVVAPAGFGKTTLLSQWAAISTEKNAWVTFDRYDNDITWFWAYVEAALKRADPNLSGFSRTGATISSQNEAVVRILSCVTAYRDPITLFLDEFNEIYDGQIHTALAYFLEHMPSNIRVVIGSRTTPPLPFGKLRMDGDLYELRASDLAFDREEAEMLLKASAGYPLEPRTVDSLMDRTRGWPAGLQIAALSLRESQDPEAFVKTFSGHNRHILDFLKDEVLGGLTEQMREFLLRTSVLERLSAEVCDSLTGGGDGERMLSTLDRSDMFLSPIDGTTDWYRYHPLFADVLRQGLRENYPDEVRALHEKAATWFHANGFIEEAIAHSIEAQNWQRVLQLVEPIGTKMMVTNRATRLRSWLSKVPRSYLRLSPTLCVSLARALMMVDLHSGFEEYLEEPEKIARENGDERLLGMVLNMRAHAELHRGRLEAAAAYCHESLDILGDSDGRHQGVAYRILGLTDLLGDRPAAAQSKFDLSFSASLDAGNPFTACASLALKGLAFSRMGLVDEGLKQVEEATAMADSTLRQPVIHIPLANSRLLFDAMRLDDALQALDRSDLLCEETGYMLFAPSMKLVCALIHWVKGDVDEAERLVERARSLRMSTGGTFDMIAVDTVLNRIRLSTGRWESVESWAEIEPVGDQANYDRLSVRARARLWRAIRNGDRTEANEYLAEFTTLQHKAMKDGRGADVVDAYVAQASAQHHLDLIDRAVASLSTAISIAEPGNLLRPFAEEGAMLKPVILEARRRKVSPAFLRTIMTACRIEDPERQSQGEIPGGLTSREEEIIRLLADGATNAEIADRLVVSPNTIKTHLQHVYTKLGSKNRTQAVARARELKLV